MNFSKARRRYALRGALFVTGKAFLKTVTFAAIITWFGATWNGSSSKALLIWLVLLTGIPLLWFATAALLFQTFRMVITGGDAGPYFQQRYENKKKRAEVSGRIKSLRTFK